MNSSNLVTVIESGKSRFQFYKFNKPRGTREADESARYSGKTSRDELFIRVLAGVLLSSLETYAAGGKREDGERKL